MRWLLKDGRQRININHETLVGLGDDGSAPPFLQPSRDDTLVRGSPAKRPIGSRDARPTRQAGRTTEASARMAELTTSLVGTTTAIRNGLVISGGGVLSDARALFYRQAFHEQPFDPAVHDDVAPEATGEVAARFSPIGGRNQHDDVRQTIGKASMTLRALSDAAKTAGPGPDAFWPTAFASWQSNVTQTLTNRLHGTLSDAQMALCEAVAQVRIKPALR